MVRIVIENILLFFLPMAVYVTYVLLTRKPESKQGLLDDAPFLWLMLAGTLMVILVLVVFGSPSGGRPDQTYHPPVMKDGKIVPGHFE